MEGKEALNRIVTKTTLPYFPTSYDINDYRKDIQTINNDLEKSTKSLEILKSKFNFYLTEIQGYKYLAVQDSRRSDALISITDEEYETLKEVL